MGSFIYFMAIALCIILVQGLPQVIISRTQIIGDPGGPGFTFSIPDFPITSRTAIIDPPYTIPTDLPTISTSTKLTSTSKTSTSKYTTSKSSSTSKSASSTFTSKSLTTSKSTTSTSKPTTSTSISSTKATSNISTSKPTTKPPITEPPTTVTYTEVTTTTDTETETETWIPPTWTQNPGGGTTTLGTALPTVCIGQIC